MKYAKFLDEQLENFSSLDRVHCIPYRRWKMMIKCQPHFIKDHWKEILHDDCRRLNRYLYPIFRKDHHHANFLGLVNTNTLYKICKKIDRHIGSDMNAVSHMTETIKSKKYKFTKSSLMTLIESDV